MSTGWMHRADAWWHARSSAISSSPGARSARGLPGGDGGVLERAPFGPQASRVGARHAADCGQLRHPLSHGRQERQERRHRRRGDLRGRVAAGMRFVPVKTCEQQGVMSLHRVREGLKEERTACINQIRGVLTEFGLVFGKSPKVLRAVLADVIEDASNELSTTARLVVQRAFEHWRELDAHMQWCDRQVGQHVRGSPEAKRAAKVIGIGELGASALTAGVGDFTQFKSGHQFGAWLGVVPRQASSGGKIRLGRITKRGDDYLRTLLIQGAKAAVMSADKRDDPTSRWLAQLTARVGWQKACVAMANKNARILWAVMTREEGFDPKHVSVKPQAKQSTPPPVAVPPPNSAACAA